MFMTDVVKDLDIIRFIPKNIIMEVYFNLQNEKLQLRHT